MKKSKRGRGAILAVLFSILIAAILTLVLYLVVYGIDNVYINSGNAVEQPKFSIYDPLPFFREVIFPQVSTFLGFSQGITDFFIDLFIGFLVGVWLTGVFWLASLEKHFFGRSLRKLIYTNQGNLKNSWLGFLGDSWWKIVPIGVFYAVVMQIPIINTVISVITLEPLLWFKSTLWGGVLKSLIIAFYIGFLPTMIEEFFKFKLRKKYYENVELERVGVAQQDIRARRR